MALSMPMEITTVTVRPERADALRQFRDENELSSLDAAVEELLTKAE